MGFRERAARLLKDVGNEADVEVIARKGKPLVVEKRRGALRAQLVPARSLVGPPTWRVEAWPLQARREIGVVVKRGPARGEDVALDGGYAASGPDPALVRGVLADDGLRARLRRLLAPEARHPLASLVVDGDRLFLLLERRALAPVEAIDVLELALDLAAALDAARARARRTSTAAVPEARGGESGAPVAVRAIDAE